MLTVSQNLAKLTDDELYRALSELAEHRRSDGHGRTMEAAYVRDYVRQESQRVRAELKQRGLPTTQNTQTAPAGQEWQTNFHFG